MGEVDFTLHEVDFDLPNQNSLHNWLVDVCKKEGKKLVSLSYVLVSDSYLLKMNQDYLDHDTYTDIITFDLSDSEAIEGEIYISIDRVKENAAKFENRVLKEFLRVVVHGLLHLIGYDDHSNEEKRLMREKEDFHCAGFTQLSDN